VPGEQPPKRSRNLVVGLVVGGVVLIVAAAIALVVVLRDSDPGIPAASSEPAGLGDDARLDDLAEDCYEGEMEACDDLYRESPRSSAYELYGGTCAGRQPNADANQVYCVDAFPGD
jgi:hypothetical protein